MNHTRPTYAVGEVIYPRPPSWPHCKTCGDPPTAHRYTVVSASQMAPSGCDGSDDVPCPCARYVPGEPVPEAHVPPEREVTWAKYANDAFAMLTAAESPTARCSQPLCRAPIWWGLTRANHKRCPFDIKPDGTRTGTSHWRTCRDRPTQSPRPRRTSRA